MQYWSFHDSSMSRLGHNSQVTRVSMRRVEVDGKRYKRGYISLNPKLTLFRAKTPEKKKKRRKKNVTCEKVKTNTTKKRVSETERVILKKRQKGMRSEDSSELNVSEDEDS